MSKDRNSHFRPPPTRGLPSAARIAAGGNQGRITARDRFNNTLVPGALVCYRPAADVVYQVEAITPVLDPRAQGGFVTVTMVAKVPLTLQANTAVMELLIVGMPPTEEQQAEIDKMRAAAEGNGAGPSGIVVPPGFDLGSDLDAENSERYARRTADDPGNPGNPDDPDPEGGFKTDEERAELDRQVAEADERGKAEAEAAANEPPPAKGPDDGEPQT